MTSRAVGRGRPVRGMRARPGFVLILAFWLIVVIAVVAAQFRVDAVERRQLGLVSAERGRGRAAALGALNLLQAELEAALVGGPTTATTNLSLSVANQQDPWLGIDTLYAGTYMIDSVPVDVYPVDLGMQLNIDSMKQTQLQTFWGLIMPDPATAQKISGAILDWIDSDTTTRTDGAEAGQYLTDNLLTLPENAPFREVDQLLQVDGITPAIYDSAAQYLTTHGTGIININTADTIVLKSLPGMSAAILANILAGRANNQRISSTSSVIPGANGGGGGGLAAGGGRGAAAGPRARGAAAGPTAAGAAARPGGGGAVGGVGGSGITPQEQQFLSATSVSTTQVELTFIARPGKQAQPTRLQAILTRTGTTSTISWMQW